MSKGNKFRHALKRCCELFSLANNKQAAAAKQRLIHWWRFSNLVRAFRTFTSAALKHILVTKRVLHTSDREGEHLRSRCNAVREATSQQLCLIKHITIVFHHDQNDGTGSWRLNQTEWHIVTIPVRLLFRKKLASVTCTCGPIKIHVIPKCNGCASTHSARYKARKQSLFKIFHQRCLFILYNLRQANDLDSAASLSLSKVPWQCSRYGTSIGCTQKVYKEQSVQNANTYNASIFTKNTSSLALSFKARHARSTTAPDLSARTKATRRPHCNRTGFQHPITMEADRSRYRARKAALHIGLHTQEH